MTIREYLTKKCLKHNKFAEKCGIQKSAFSRYVNGSRTPNVLCYIKIKNASNGMITEFDYLIESLPELTKSK